MAARRRSQHQLQPSTVDGDQLEPADSYAPSPGTCSAALTRANQLRVQALLRQLLVCSADFGVDRSGGEQAQRRQNRHQQQGKRLDTLRVLRRTMRELDYQLSWLAQVDLMETMERLLQGESENAANYDWRLVNDCTHLLIETVPRLPNEPDGQLMSQILTVVVQNLGHPRSEVRRASLLLLNMYINERPQQFGQVLRIFIDYGLANHRNRQAQRGAILSLPLLMTERTVEGENLLPLVRCLGELLVDADSKLFYSLYLALQRLNLTLGDARFGSYLSKCDPEAVLLYKQAASRSNSLAGVSGSYEPININGEHSGVDEPSKVAAKARRQSIISSSSQIQQNTHSESEQKQVTFEQLSSNDSTSADGLSLPKDDAPDTSDQKAQLTSRSPSSSSSIGSIGSAQSESSPSSLTPADQMSQAKAETIGDKKSRSSRISSSVSSTCSSEAMLVDPSHYMSAAALAGRPLSAYQQVHQQQLADHSATGLAINDLSVSCTPTIELGPAAKTELSFGIFPRHLITAALAPDNAHHYQPHYRFSGASELSAIRLAALEEIMCIIRDSPINHLAILMTYFDSFLEQFLARLMVAGPALEHRHTQEPIHHHHVDHRVQIIAIDMIETIVIKTKVSTMHYIRPLIGLLLRPLMQISSLDFNQERPASSQILRDNAIRVVHKMMAYLPPQHVIDAIFEHKHSKSALVREEAINRVTGAVLEYDRNEFNLTKLCYHVLPMLADHHAQVRLAALECIATLAHVLGPDRIGSLLTAAEAVQTGCDYDGLLDAIHARLMRRSLPRCNPDGSIRYVIKPFLSATSASYHQEHQAADLRWVLEAPSAHQHVLHHTNNNHDWAHGHSPSHRPGAYSPPQMGRRRSSVGLLASQLALAHAESGHHSQKHHHHHQPHRPQAHQKQQDSARQLSQEHGRRPSHQLPQHRVNQSQQDAINSLCPTGEATDDDGGTPSKLGSPISQAKSESDCGSPSELNMREHGIATAAAQDSQPLPVPSADDAKLRKSNSHDSLSSTDTNKVLFRYYLSKFRQSLAESASNGAANMNSVLPSDSIIYTTDTSQIYASSRRKSRQLQTSFDYDPISGQTAVGRQANGFMQSQVNQLNQEVLSASSGSPTTVVEAEQNQKSEDGDIKRSRQDRHRKSSTLDERSSHSEAKPVEYHDGQVELKSVENQPEQQQNLPHRQRQRTLTRQAASTRDESLSVSSVDSQNTPVDQSVPGQLVKNHSQTSTDNVSVRSGVSGQSSSSNNKQKVEQQERRHSRRKSRSIMDTSSDGLQADRDGDGDGVVEASEQRIEFEPAPNETQGEIRRRKSKSQPPTPRAVVRTSSKQDIERQQQDQARQADRGSSRPASDRRLEPRRACSVSPSVSSSVNIRQILENVAELEGPFSDPTLALRVAMSALEGPCWSTKVEGLLALIRLASHHPTLVASHMHEVVTRVAQETQNLRSTVARSAIFSLGDFCAKLKRQIEPEMDIIVQALLQKSMENTAFIRDDIRRAFSSMCENLTQWRLANCLISQGGSHRNVHVRRMASQFIAYLVDRLGPAKCLVGARDIGANLIPAAARFAQDSSPHTRYYGRLILDRLMTHGAYERLARKYMAPNLYRSTVGIIESIRRRGPGELPAEL